MERFNVFLLKFIRHATPLNGSKVFFFFRASPFVEMTWPNACVVRSFISIYSFCFHPFFVIDLSLLGIIYISASMTQNNHLPFGRKRGISWWGTFRICVLHRIFAAYQKLNFIKKYQEIFSTLIDGNKLRVFNCIYFQESYMGYASLHGILTTHWHRVVSENKKWRENRA